MTTIRLLLLLGLAFYVGCSAPAPRLRPVSQMATFTGDYVDVGDADRPPQMRTPTAPRYPVWLRRQGVNGVAEIAYLVEKDGTTSQVQVVAANDVDFGEAARAAVAQWRFRPGLKDGAPVRVAVKQVVHFNLNSP